MEEKIMMLDEQGQEKEATIINIVEINNQDYLIYSISKNEDEDEIYVSKIIKDQNNNEDLVSITDESERRIVYDTIRSLIDEID